MIVEVRVVGQPGEVVDRDYTHLAGETTLRELLTSLVREEVMGYETRRKAQSVVRVLTPADLASGPEGAQPTSSPAPRVARRRAAVIEEAVNHAIDLMQADGVGALTISEAARRMGIRGPSLYKYFPSRHALYDVLFSRGLAQQLQAIGDAVSDLPPGVPRLRAGGIAIVRWAVENPALAQLLHWRPVPGFEPSPPTFEPSVRNVTDLRGELAEAVRLGQLSPAADSDVVVLLRTVMISGLISQQLANQPGVPFEQGTFSRLTDQAIDQFLSAYRS